jgi:predicted transcriptional regulator
MLETMPQEVEVRYIIPAIRRDLAKSFIKTHKLSQKEAAKMLGLTEAAISQYRHLKRAKQVEFDKSTNKEIEISASKIINEKNNKQRLIAEIYRISMLPAVKQILCELHKAQSKDLHECNICFDEGLINLKT